MQGSVFELKNGMKVILLEDHKAPIIKHMVWYKNGASDEKEGKGGVAHLLEHLMFRGTKNLSGEEAEELMEEHGVISNAFTSQDYTAYHQFSDISKLEMLMLIEADRMRNLKISNKDFSKERDVVFQERMQQIETKPVALFMENVRKKLWGEHPYSRPVSGTVEEIKSLTREDAKEYYDSFYTPENAILVLSGDLDLDTAKDLAEKYYGSIENSKIYKSPKVYEIANTGKQSLTEYDEKVKSPKVVYAFVAPSYNINPQKAIALEVLEEYLGADKISPFYKKVVEKSKIAAQIAVSNGFEARGYDTFHIVLHINPEVDIKDLEKETNRFLAEAIAELDEQKAEAAKKRILARLVYVADNPEDKATMVGAMAIGGMKLEDIISYDEQIRKVSYEDVKTAAEELINDAPSVFGLLLPKNMESEAAQ